MSWNGKSGASAAQGLEFRSKVPVRAELSNKTPVTAALSNKKTIPSCKIMHQRSHKKCIFLHTIPHTFQFKTWKFGSMLNQVLTSERERDRDPCPLDLKILHPLTLQMDRHPNHQRIGFSITKVLPSYWSTDPDFSTCQTALSPLVFL